MIENKICYYPELCQGIDKCFACRVYTEGRLPPEYPVPAIRQHFEFCWSLSDRKPILFHVVYGVYDG